MGGKSNLCDQAAVFAGVKREAVRIAIQVGQTLARVTETDTFRHLGLQFSRPCTMTWRFLLPLGVTMNF